MALVSQSDLEARLGRTLTTDEQTSFTVINSAMQKYVEGLVSSEVESVSESSRYFDGGEQLTLIDPCTDVTAVKYVDREFDVVQTIETDDYVLEPINQTVKKAVRYRAGKLPKGVRNIEVVAKYSVYGDEDIRNVIKDALLEALEKEVINSDNIKSEKIEGYSVEYATDEARSAIDRLKYFFPEVM